MTQVYNLNCWQGQKPVLVPRGSVADPDPHRSKLWKVPWIRIRMEDKDPDLASIFVINFFYR